MFKKVMLTYARAKEEYPSLWLVLTEREVKKNPWVTTDNLKPETLRMIVEKVGEKWEHWTSAMIQELIQGPNGDNPMLLLSVEDGEGVRQMTEAQLDEALRGIDLLDNESLETPREWDETPVG